jgi:hypothetical protein
MNLLRINFNYFNLRCLLINSFKFSFELILEYFFSSYLGRPRHTLPLTINNDLKLAAAQPRDITSQFNLPSQLKTITELRSLEKLANDRDQWIQLVICVTNMQVPEPPKPIKPRTRRNAKQ